MYPPLRWCNSRTRRGIPCTSFLRSRGSKLFHLSTRARTRSSSMTTSVTSHTVPNVFDMIHMGAPPRPLKIFNPLLGKRICNNTCPMWTGIVVLKYGACFLMCSEMWIHNTLKDIVNVTLPCQSLSNNLEIKLVVMTKAAPHHNGSTTEHFSFTNDVILKLILSTSTSYANTPIRKV